MNEFILTLEEQQKLTPKQWRLVQIAIQGQLTPLVDERNKMEDTATKMAVKANMYDEPTFFLGMASHYVTIQLLLTRLIEAIEAKKKVRVV